MFLCKNLQLKTQLSARGNPWRYEVLLEKACQLGSNWNNGSNAGLFYFNLNNDSSNTNSNIGSHLCYVCDC